MQSPGWKSTYTCYLFSFKFLYYFFHYFCIFISSSLERIQLNSSYLSQNMSHVYELIPSRIICGQNLGMGSLGSSEEDIWIYDWIPHNKNSIPYEMCDISLGLL